MNIVEEPMEVYKRVAPIAYDNIAIVFKSRQGVNIRTFYDIINLSGLKRERLAEIFHTSLKTILRYTETNQNFDTLASEQALKILGMYIKGIEVFGNINSFRSWLARPQFGLGNQIPIDLMESIIGIELIIEEIIRIEYGATA